LRQNRAFRIEAHSMLRVPRGRGIAPADLCAVLSVALLCALSAYRAHLVDAAYGRFTGCEHCFDASVWANDAYLLAGFTALLAVSRLVRSRIGRIALAAISAAGIACYVADVVVFRLLAQRLLVTDVLHYGGEGPVLFTVLWPLARSAEGVALFAGAFAALALAAAAFLARPSRRWGAASWAIATGAMLAAAHATPQAVYLHQTAFRNVWQVNERADPSRAYTVAFWNRERNRPRLPATCEPGRAAPLSVVLVVVESLSAYHSALFSGLHDYTPKLDALARRGTWFPEFFANGYSTEGGLIALLTGHVPIPTAGRFGSVMAFTDVVDDFHRRLAARGYDVAFFTGGKLSFGKRDEWLRAIGIPHAEGAESPYYRGMARGSFDAPEDKALVDRFLQWHSERRGDAPFMATVLTVETHAPFYSPATRRSDEGAAVREVDAQLARLAAELERRGFFAHGVLLIVGDHRAMTPIPQAELERLGPSASARIVAIALGATGLPRGRQDGRFQQADLIPSLEYLLSDRSCRTPGQGRFLGPDPQPARWVVRADPLRRNQLDVSDASAEHHILLDGDDTRWLDAPSDGVEARRILGEVNRERMSRMVELRSAATAGRR
jgi:hypothetical protein